jgi:hypothetical protein
MLPFRAKRTLLLPERSVDPHLKQRLRGIFGRANVNLQRDQKRLPLNKEIDCAECECLGTKMPLLGGLIRDPQQS